MVLCEQEETWRQFYSLNLITKNFIQLTVGFSSQKPYIISDKPAMHFDDFVAAYGGSLSLWLGMTTAFSFEILELFYVIAKSYLRWNSKGVKTETQSKITEMAVDSSRPNL